MKTIKLLPIIVLAFLFVSIKGNCTWCSYLPIEQNIEVSDLIFIGTVKSGACQTDKYDFSIERILKKSKKFNSKKVSIFTSNIIWGCGTSVPENERQLVMAKLRGGKYYIYIGDHYSLKDPESERTKIELVEALLNLNPNLPRAQFITNFKLEDYVIIQKERRPNRKFIVPLIIGISITIAIGLYFRKKN